MLLPPASRLDVFQRTSRSRIAALVFLVLGCLTSRLAAAPGMGASLLVFTEGKPIGFSLGWGWRWNAFYLGGELLTHHFSETTTTGTFSSKASAKMLVPGVVAKGFLPLTGSLDLYAGAGLGYGATRIDHTLTIGGVTNSASTTSDDLATQVLVGLQHRLGPTGAVKLGWRYLKVEDLSLAGGTRLTADSHAVELGFHFEF